MDSKPLKPVPDALEAHEYQTVQTKLDSEVPQAPAGTKQDQPDGGRIGHAP